MNDIDMAAANLMARGVAAVELEELVVETVVAEHPDWSEAQRQAFLREVSRCIGKGLHVTLDLLKKHVQVPLPFVLAGELSLPLVR